MSVTVQRVFDAAIYALAEQSETGLTDTAETAEYKTRTLSILNTLVPALYPYSDGFSAGTAGVRPAPAEMASFSDAVPLDDALCASVLPLGLAFMLVLNEDRVFAGNLKALYDEALAQVKNRIPAASEAITDLYGAAGTGDEE